MYASSGGLLEASLEAAPVWLPVGGRLLRLFAYNQSVPGPLLEARPGDTLRLRLINRLAEPTNLHFHGLHVSPLGRSDNIWLHVEPGAEQEYELAIPENHPPSTYWYHPHLHGTAARQVSHGLAGLLLIRGEFDAIPEIAAAREHFLVLQDFDPGPSGEVREPGMMERIWGREGPLITVNGQLHPEFEIEQDGWLRLHLLNASASRFYRLRLEDHSFWQVATDGGPLPAPIEREELLLTPGERAQIMVAGSRPGGAYRLLSLPYNRGPGAPGSTTLLASFLYRGQAKNSWKLPSFFTEVEPLPVPDTAPRRIVLGQTMMPGFGMAFTLNGRPFVPGRTDGQAKLDTIEDWEFHNPTNMDHPMHIHTNAFQLLGPDTEPERAWRDVALVRAGARIRLRIAFRDFVGKTVYHCHILDHEDMGMMGTLEIR